MFSWSLKIQNKVEQLFKKLIPIRYVQKLLPMYKKDSLKKFNLPVFNALIELIKTISLIFLCEKGK